MIDINVLKDNWNLIKKRLKEEYDITKVSFSTWIEPLEIDSVDGEQVTILISDNSADKFVVDYLTKRYQKLFQIMIEEVTNFHCTVNFITANHDSSQNTNFNSDSFGSPQSYSLNLNPKYTFDSFVVGANNKFAHAASLAVAESPGASYNPLFIYGGVGLGKTHLMHSIGHFILKNTPDAKVMYVSSEKFTNELIDAIRNKNGTNTFAFREKYRSIDVLLVDDIQFIIGKESTQEEFFHTFNFLHENNKQIVISSDKPPKAFATLEDRLRSRFEMGLPVDISEPDYETRMAILRKKEETEGYNIDNEIIKYIATNIKANIRELEGALTKVIAYTKLYNKEMSLATAEEALRDLIAPATYSGISPATIISVVAEHFNHTPEDLLSQKRSKDIAYPRQIAMYLCREMTDVSLQALGKHFGNRDHSTILHGCERISQDLNKNEDLADTLEIIKKKLTPG